MGVTSIQGSSARSNITADRLAGAVERGVRRTAPNLGGEHVTAGMGIEALAALLMSESARTTGKLMRDLQRDAKEAQASAMERQVSALHEKASDMASEALVAGTFTAAGGALTIASAAAGPSASDAAKAKQWDDAAKQYGHGFAAVAKQCATTLEAQKAAASALATAGNSATGLANPLAKGTFGAQQILDDAAATRAAADAKFAESARDEYAALAREFDAGSQKALQILQAMTVERHAVRRSLLQRA